MPVLDENPSPIGGDNLPHDGHPGSRVLGDLGCRPLRALRGDREAELVVLTPGKSQLQRLSIQIDAGQINHRDSAGIDHDTDIGRITEVAEVSCQPIGDVDHGCGKLAAQHLDLRHPSDWA